ncbi:MAG: molybdenum cofactor biosynthesis protein MoaE [Eubacteriales bacterium]|nr:molybdenum cofactor biosynthesis protein MoaE [Eubacteriales bacterium]
MSKTGKNEIPSLDLWLKEAKSDPRADNCGMYLFHNGVVRKTAKAQAHLNEKGTLPITGLLFTYEAQKVSEAIALASRMEGIHYVRAWLNKGQLDVGDDIMLVLVGGDIRPRVVAALQALVEELKTNCVVETELF